MADLCSTVKPDSLDRGWCMVVGVGFKDGRFHLFRSALLFPVAIPERIVNWSTRREQPYCQIVFLFFIIYSYYVSFWWEEISKNVDPSARK